MEFDERTDPGKIFVEPSSPQSENPYEAPRFDVRTSYGQREDRSELEVTDWVLAAICSVIACIVGLIWLIQGKPKGLKMIGVSFLFVFLWNALRYLIVALVE